MRSLPIEVEVSMYWSEQRAHAALGRCRHIKVATIKGIFSLVLFLYFSPRRGYEIGPSEVRAP